MGERLTLHQLLSDIEGVEGVYFQPIENVQMEHPCIVYERDFASPAFADNIPYLSFKRYQVTVIDRDPDSEIPDAVAQLPYCSFSRFFKADNLNHDVFNLFF